VKDIVATMISGKVLCGSFGLYPSYVAGILNSVKEINFHILCCEKLNYADNDVKYFACKAYSVTYKARTENYFELSSSNGKIVLSFEARQFPKLSSGLDFARSGLKRMRLSSLAFGIVCINKCVTCITNEVLMSRHDCVFDFDLHLPK